MPAKQHADGQSDASTCSPGDIANGLLHAADDHPCCKATLHAAANLLVNLPDKNGPLRRAFSRSEIVEAMNQWMLETHGHPMQLEVECRDRWYRDNGMLHAFLCANFPAENAAVDLTGSHGAPNTNRTRPSPSF